MKQHFTVRSNVKAATATKKRFTVKASSYVKSDDEIYEDIQEISQEFTSENTSINSTKLPAVFKMVNFEPGTINIDYGGGRFDNVADYLTQYDVINLVYDPYNRSKEHNAEVVKTVRAAGGADTATCSNVLNVIKEPEVRQNVLNNIKKLVKPGGKIYITVYEGSGKGDEGPTKSGYQLNRKTADYIEEIQQVFPDATRKGKLIQAVNASTDIQSATIEELQKAAEKRMKKQDQLGKQLDTIQDKALKKFGRRSKINALDDYRLDPPEYDEPDEVEFSEQIEVDLDCIINIDSDGSWEYEDTTYPWAQGFGSNGTWYTDEHNVYIGDPVDIVECVDDMLQAYLPDTPGRYQLSGTATLSFNISDIYKTSSFQGMDEDNDPILDEEFYKDDASADFDFGNSYISNFDCEPLEESIESATDVTAVTNQYPEFNTVYHGKQKFAVHSTDMTDVFHFACQVTEIHPYDDADYCWARMGENKQVQFIQKGKVIDKMQMHYYEPEDYESPYDYIDDIVDSICVELLQFNRSVEPRMMHN